MKCANPDCDRGIGLVSHQRGWFDKRRYCSRPCRDAFVARPWNRSEQEPIATTYFEWLFLQRPQPARLPVWSNLRR
jgi:hypothetical protein